MEGNIAQMNTGEGKTVSAISPACIHALLNWKVYITSVNDYLTKRDWESNKIVFDFFGINSCFLSNDETKHQVIKDAYENNELIYTTVSRLAYNYLNNNLVLDEEKKIEMKLDFIISDEVDQSSLDNSQESLIISKREILKDFSDMENQLSNMIEERDKFEKSLNEAKQWMPSTR